MAGAANPILPMSIEFTPLCFVKVRLLKGAIYRQEKEDWELVRANQDHIGHYFQQLGRELVLDETEGFAFLRQIEIDGMERIPRLTRRMPLTYQATLLLVCLREEFCRFDTSIPDSTRLIKTESELQDLISAFLAETTNQVRDVSRISSAIQRLCDLGFLEKISADPNTYEIKPIVKARLGPEQLEEIKERLKSYANAKLDSDPNT